MKVREAHSSQPKRIPAYHIAYGDYCCLVNCTTFPAALGRLWQRVRSQSEECVVRAPTEALALCVAVFVDVESDRCIRSHRGLKCMRRN
jgi:hypothetical protein